MHFILEKHHVVIDGRRLPIIAGGFGGGKARAPQAKEVPDPSSEQAKQKEAEERTKINQKRGTAKTIATGPQGVLGSAPTSRPELKGTLG